MLPLPLAAGMRSGHMFRLTQACYFSFYPYLFPLDRGTSLEGFRILVPCQAGSTFPEAVFRCRGSDFSLHLQTMLHVFRNQELWMIQVRF